MRADVIVVGGGIAGTVAAATAARTGATVVLLEAAAPGGRARTHVQGGFAFNQGPHALYAGGAFRRTLDELGVPWSGRAPALDAGIALWGAAHYPLPSSLASLATARPFGVRDRIELAKFWGRVGKGADAGDGTLRDVTRSMRPKVGAFVEAFSRLSTYANAPDAIDARAAFAQMRLALGGVLYLDGGWQTLVDGLAAAATRAGAVIVPSARAATVERAGSDWRVALVDGREWRGGAVVVAVSQGHTSLLHTPHPTAAAASVPRRAGRGPRGGGRRGGAGGGPRPPPTAGPGRGRRRRGDGPAARGLSRSRIVVAARAVPGLRARH